MNGVKILIVFLLLTNSIFSQWIRLQIRTEIPGSLYIDNRKIKDISVGEIYKGRYKNGNYILSLKNSEAIYQKEIQLSEKTEVFYKITEKDLLKRLVPEKPKVIVVEKIVEKEKIKIVEKVVEKPVEKIVEKVIEKSLEKPSLEITKNNFEQSVVEKIRNGTAYDVYISMIKFEVIEDEKTKNYIYLKDKDGKSIKIDSYIVNRSVERGRYPNEYGVIYLEYYLKFKNEFYNDLFDFYASLGKNSFEDINIKEIKNTNSDSKYIIKAKNTRVKDSYIVDKIVEVNHIELRENKKYVDALKNFENIKPKFDLLDKNEKVLINSHLTNYYKNEIGRNSVGNYYSDFYHRSNMSGIYYNSRSVSLLKNDGIVKEGIYIVLPIEKIEKIQKIKVRSIF